MKRFMRNRTSVLATAVAMVTIPLAATTAHGQAAAPADTESATAGAKWRDLLPIGVWEGKLEIPEGTYTIYVSFDHKGKACLQGGGGAKGTGYWYPTGKNTFSYRITEKFPSPDDSPQGRAEISDDATQTGDAYHAKGTSKVFDAAGNHVGTYEGESDFVRVSTTDPGRVCRA